MEGTPRDDAEPAPFDAAADVVPEHVAVTLAELNDRLSALMELRYGALSAGEVAPQCAR